ncbi:MAG: alpha/beta hydrolase fold domain-containing protein [Planctomycetota bacterium]|nr:alpha/beta hydrolase fold domain-containing protein [Planctomycetota bacterium]
MRGKRITSLLFLMSCTAAVPASELISDVSYVSPGGMRTFLDIHRPDDGLVSGTPTVLFIHGGGWYGGDKADANVLTMLGPMADLGYGVVSCNYTLSVDMSPSYPQAVHDVKAVVRWIRTAGATYGLSPTIVVTGPSAGGHLSQLLGTSAGVGVFEPLPEPPGGYRIQGSVPFWGLSDFVMQVEDWGNTGPFSQFLGGPLNAKTYTTYVEASPITWVSADDPPMHMIHGYGDPIHDWNSSRVLDEAFELVDVPCGTEFFDGGHSFPDYGGFEAATERVLELIPELLAQDRSADIDGSGDVGTDDVLAVLAAWGGCAPLPVDCPADLDNNGTVDVDDLLAVVAAW